MVWHIKGRIAEQSHVQQVIMANARAILRNQKDVLRFVLEAPRNVRWLRKTTAWSSTELQEEVIAWMQSS